MRRTFLCFVLVLGMSVAGCGTPSTEGNGLADFGLQHGDVLSAQELSDLLDQGFSPDAVVHPALDESVDPSHFSMLVVTTWCWHCTQWTVLVDVDFEGNQTITLTCNAGYWMVCDQVTIDLPGPNIE